MINNNQTTKQQEELFLGNLTRKQFQEIARQSCRDQVAMAQRAEKKLKLKK